jgi:4-amino-4-deoxy-L-arabinose transferase-like glycosyltransferase
LRLLTPAAVAFALALAAWAAFNQGWTYDEPFHIEWSERFLLTGETERASKERFNSKTPINILNVAARQAASAAGVRDARALRFAARLPTVGWLLLLLSSVFLVTRAFFGEDAAHLATVAAALDPNLVAHGSLATTDVPFALGTLLTLAAAARFAEAPTASRGAVLGLALGLAFAAKFAAVTLLPCLALIPAALPRRRGGSGRFGRVPAGLLAAAVCLCLLLAAVYLFRGLGHPLSATPWRSTAMARLAAACPWLIPPVPAAFLTGLDATAATYRGAEWNVILLGRRYVHGAWFYFGLLWLLKTPVLVLLALMLGLSRAARAGVLAAHPAARYLAACLVFLLLYLSFFFEAQIGYRFALGCVVLACVLSAPGLASLKGRRWAAAGLAAVAVAAAENAMYAGNPLSFTNAAVWPKRQAFRLVSDSNLDWGQNRDKIERWLKDARARTTALDPVHVLPGHNTFSVNALAGLWSFEQHRWLREHADPLGHYGHTYVWFEVEDGLYYRFLGEQRRLAADPAAAADVCADADDTERLGPGARPPFSVSGQPQPGEVWIACVSTRKGAQFGLRALKGHARFGPCGAAGGPRWERLEQGQEAWYALDPGRHVLCVSQIPNRREWLPNVFEGRWLVRERGISLGLRRGILEGSGRLRVAGPP